MKKRSMILALASMLGISAAATAVSGFAWFTTQMTASIQTHSYSVGASQGALLVEEGSTNHVNVTDVTVDNTNAATITLAAGDLADVSSADGNQFYQLKNIDKDSTVKSAKVVDEGTLASKIEGGKFISSVNTNQLVCVSWTLDITNETAGTLMDVYLTKNSATLFTDATGTYANAYRLAIHDETDSNNLVFLYTSANTYIQSTDINNLANGVGDLVVGDRTGDAIFDGTGVLTNGTYMSSVSAINAAAATAATAAPGNQCLIKGLGAADAAAKHTLRFTVWCEGTITPEAPVASNEVQLAFNLAAFQA